MLRLTVKHFLQDDCRQNAASLTFTTLFAVVPMTTVVFSGLSAIPSMKPISGQIQQFIFTHFIPSTGDTVQNYLAEFSTQASKLTFVGIGMLFVTALMMLSTVERAFNHIWQVQAPRQDMTSFLRYWAVLSLGPLLLGAGFVLSSYLMSLRILSDTADIVDKALPGLGLVPMLFTAAGFTLLYTTVPNCRVPFRAGLISGISAAILFELVKRGFGIFVTNFSSYKLVYGAFAAVPVFLLWIYVSWMIILFGVELSRGVMLQERTEGGHRHPLLTMLSLLALLQRQHMKGEGVREVDAMRIVGRQHTSDWLAFSSLLYQTKLIRMTGTGDLVLARDLSQLDFATFYRQMPWPLPTAAELAAYPHEPWLVHVSDLLQPIQHSMDKSLVQPLGHLLAAEV